MVYNSKEQGQITSTPTNLLHELIAVSPSISLPECLSIFHRNNIFKKVRDIAPRDFAFLEMLLKDDLELGILHKKEYIIPLLLLFYFSLCIV